MSRSSHLPDQPIMKYVHPADRLRPWFGVAVGLAALVGMLAFGILGRNFALRGSSEFRLCSANHPSELHAGHLQAEGILW